MNTALDALLAGAGVWRARGGAPPARGTNVMPSGRARLDAELPDGGWPLGTLIEFLLPEPGVGELSLLLPALQVLAAEPAAQGRHWFAWIAPPLDPYPPALAQGGIPPERMLLVGAAALRDRLWSAEQALRSGSCAAVLAWIDRVDDRWLRRLKLAAESGAALVVLFRARRHAGTGSAASLRLELEPTATGLDLHLLKRRGGGPVRVHDALGA
jgi:cell division inhibitor SulA/protein ImuA